jgi:AcrR family transcriptional regulator
MFCLDRNPEAKLARRKTSAGQLAGRDWLRAALDALETGGIGAVRILSLASALGASRGSFYWHFRDRDDLLARMLEFWETELTDRVIERARRADQDPRAQLRALLEDVLEQRQGRYDPAVRAWALHDKRAAAAARRVDRTRFAFAESLFREMGFGSAEAAARGRLTLAYLEGDHFLLVREAPKDRRRFLELRHRLLTAR